MQIQEDEKARVEESVHCLRTRYEEKIDVLQNQLKAVQEEKQRVVLERSQLEVAVEELERKANLINNEATDLTRKLIKVSFTSFSFLP